MNVFGRNGSGKTWFGCTFPKPLFLAGFEDGTDTIRNVKGVDFVQIYDTVDIPEVVNHIRTGVSSNGERYRSVVVDTATSLQDVILKEILKLNEVPVQLKWGMVDQKQYLARSEKTKEFLRLFLDLAKHNINVVVLAQEKNHTARDAEANTENEVITPFIASSLGSSTCAWLQENCDNICQTYTREQTEDVSIPIGDQIVKSTKKTGKIEFCLRTQRAHPVYAAKIRADKNVVFPDILVDPTYDKFMKLTGGK